MAQLTERTSLIAGAVAAVGASVCCVGPLILLMLGVGGTWVGSLTAMEPFRPLFISTGRVQVMPGWNVSLYRQEDVGKLPAATKSEVGERIAVWQTGLGGLDWLSGLAKIGNAIDLGDGRQ